LQRRTGRITGTLSQDNEGTAEPAIIDDGANRPALVGEVVVSGDDEERLVTKITPGDLDVAMTGTITHQQGQLIEDRRRKRTTLDADALGDSRDVEEKLVIRTGHDDK